jgi:hypothetical protein
MTRNPLPNGSGAQPRGTSHVQSQTLLKVDWNLKWQASCSGVLEGITLDIR